MTLEDQKTHENDAMNQHLSLALKKISSQESNILKQEAKSLSQEERISALEKKLEELDCKSTPGTLLCDAKNWKINNFEKKLEKADQQYNLQKEFYTSQGHKVSIQIYLNDRDTKNLAFYFKTTEGLFDDTLNWPMKATIACFLLSNEGEIKLHNFVTTDTGYNECFGKPSTKSVSAVGRVLAMDRNEILSHVTNNSIAFKFTVSY